ELRKGGLSMEFACRLSLGFAVAAAAPAFAQLNDLDEALRTTPITTQQLAENFHVLFGVGGNILVSIGTNGVLIVDDQFPQMVPKYKATIGELGGGAIDFAINTHWHFDHADGNQVLGPEGTWLVAHEVSRQMMTKNNVINLVSATRDQPAYPETALPVLTYDDSMRFHFNGERIDLMHFGPAHTTGDTAVVFRGHKVVHLGDVYNNAGYPFIDADNGGSLSGVIEFCSRVLAEIDSTYMVVPGHGPIADAQALADYVTMLTTIRDRMSALIESGATLEQVEAAQPTSEWDERKGDPENFLNRAYLSLSRERR
ncbi:MAG TPA: MBL fold metallo-hydrolase, partial [Gammaproteobacteria bacterium]|nr:MBL fold metallo-hydrolase [Gammaproteobacteria bacterium]